MEVQRLILKQSMPPYRAGGRLGLGLDFVRTPDGALMITGIGLTPRPYSECVYRRTVRLGRRDSNHRISDGIAPIPENPWVKLEEVPGES